MALAWSGHAFRCRHPRSTPPVRESAACDTDRFAARALLGYIAATLWERGRAGVVLLADEARREDSSLEVIIESSARGQCQ